MPKRKKPKAEDGDGLHLNFIGDFFAGRRTPGLQGLLERDFGERAVVEAAIALANDEQPDSATLRLLGVETLAPPPSNDLALVQLPKAAIQSLSSQATEACRVFRRFLIDLMEQPESVRSSKALQKLGDPSGRVMAKQHFVDDRGAIRAVRQLSLPDVPTALAYAALLLLSQDYPFGKELGRCGLDTCGKFFLTPKVSRGGAPRRKFCSEVHMKDLHKLQGSQRLRDYRERKAKGLVTPRRSK